MSWGKRFIIAAAFILFAPNFAFGEDWMSDYDPYRDTTEYRYEENCTMIERFDPETITYKKVCLSVGTDIDKSKVYMENWGETDPYALRDDTYNPFGLDNNLEGPVDAVHKDLEFTGYPIMRGTVR